jgi:hypothetical protein
MQIRLFDLSRVEGEPGGGGRKEELYGGEEREDVPVQTCWS